MHHSIQCGQLTASAAHLTVRPTSPRLSQSVRRSERRARKAAAAASAAGQTDGGSPHSVQDWNQITNRLVSSSSIPFSILVLPQVVQNMTYMASGNMSALSVISWEGYLSGLLGNTLMCSHFANSGEQSAVTVQLIGIVNNMAVLTQVAIASCMPRMVFFGVAACVLLAVAMSLARLTGRIPATSGKQAASGSMSVWQVWQLVSGVFGLAVVPQVLYNVLIPGNPTLMPFCVTLAALTLWYLAPGNRVDRQGRSTVESLPGWASTLLFALSPLPQLVRNFVDAGSLEGLSVGTMLLALLGNALMVPRALFVRDRIWQLGTCWACMAGWGQLLSMFLKHSPTTGLRYIQPALFAGVTLVLGGYFTFVLRRNAQVQQLATKTKSS